MRVKSIGLILLAVSVLALTWVLVSTELPTRTLAWGITVSAAKAEKVVVFSCFLSDGGLLRVEASSSSVNAPVVSPGTECAQALADVLAAGFKLESVEAVDHAQSLV